MPRFSEVATTPIDDIKPPKPLCVGHYIFLVDGPPEFDSGISQKTNEPYERYTVKCRPVKSGDDVDQGLLRDTLEGDKLADRTINLAIFEPHVMVTFLQACGIKGRMGEAVAQLPGKQFMAHVTHNPGQRDKTRLYANIEQGTWTKA
jgi:hypothetical protein